VTGTFDTPFGRLRVGSMRRFILVRANYRDGKPFVVKRSDTRSNLDRFVHEGDFILDTARKET